MPKTTWSDLSDFQPWSLSVLVHDNHPRPDRAATAATPKSRASSACVVPESGGWPLRTHVLLLRNPFLVAATNVLPPPEKFRAAKVTINSRPHARHSSQREHQRESMQRVGQLTSKEPSLNANSRCHLAFRSKMQIAFDLRRLFQRSRTACLTSLWGSAPSPLSSARFPAVHPRSNLCWPVPVGPEFDRCVHGQSSPMPIR